MPDLPSSKTPRLGLSFHNLDSTVKDRRATGTTQIQVALKSVCRAAPRDQRIADGNGAAFAVLPGVQWR